MADTGTATGATGVVVDPAIAAAAAAATATATGATGTDKPWYDGKADAETIGWLQNRAWDKLSPTDVAINAVKAHREAEKLIGAPADRMVRLPTDPNSADWSKVWERLGAPVDGKYDLSGVKFADGTALDQPFVDAFTKTISSLHLPKDTASQVAKGFVDFMDASEKSEADQRAVNVATEKAALQKEWQAGFEANMFVAKSAAAKLGVTPEAVAALESQVGYTAVMKMFHKIGTQIGEARFIENGAPGANGVMSREQAIATKQSYMRDNDWVNRYQNGGKTEFEQMTGLNRIISGDFDAPVAYSSGSNYRG